MAERIPTRRALIGAAIMAPAAAAVASCVGDTPAKGASGVTPELAALIAASRYSERLGARYDHAVCTPAMARSTAAAAAVPHQTTQQGFTATGGEYLTFATDSDMHVGIARRVVADIDAGKLRSAADTDYDLTMRELVRLADERAATIAGLPETRAAGHAEDRSYQLGEEAADASAAMTRYPARTLADLAAKVALIDELGAWEESRDAIIADLMRLAGAA